jgi:glutamyl-Q tRNA(Asp) synthetase
MSASDKIYMGQPYLTRFAPSPTGRLHLGHAYAAAQVFKAAEHKGAAALLRIEDIDHTRCRPDYISGIYEDLAWLGFDWPRPPRVQSAHYAAYANVVIDLIERGLAYPCTLSRTQLKAGERTPPESTTHGKAARACDEIRKAARYKTPSLPYAIRLNLKAALKQSTDELTYREGACVKHARQVLDDWALSPRPDPIIARRDIAASYHIAVTHDDHHQGITHVIRGADFIDQTPLHILLQSLMGWATPIYSHHALITDADGRKFSKTDRDLTIQSLRESGLTAADVLSQALEAL